MWWTGYSCYDPNEVYLTRLSEYDKAADDALGDAGAEKTDMVAGGARARTDLED